MRPTTAPSSRKISSSDQGYQMAQLTVKDLQLPQHMPSNPRQPAERTSLTTPHTRTHTWATFLTDYQSHVR